MTEGNDAAFARPFFGGGGDFCSEQDGLTKHEYFAAMAMQGLLAEGSVLELAGKKNDDGVVAQVAVQYADDLIAELNKPKEESNAD